MRLAARRGDADEDVAWLADVLARFIGGEAFEGSAGLDSAWRSQLRFRNRDALLRQAAAFFPTAPATRLAAKLSRYRALTWPRTRLAAQDPHLPDTVESQLWQALKLVDRDLSRRQVARIIGDASGHAEDLSMSTDLLEKFGT